MKNIKHYVLLGLNLLIIIIPFTISCYIAFKGLKLNIHFGLRLSLSAVLTLGFLTISLGLHTIFHEFGHLLAGLMSGYKYLFFRIWIYALVKENKKFKIKNFHIPGSLGQCLMAPPKLKNGDYPFLFYNLGGITMNILLSLLALISMFFISNKLLAAALVAFIAVGLYLAFINAYPFPGIPNDGTNIKSISSSLDSKKAFYNALLVSQLTVTGQTNKNKIKRLINEKNYQDFSQPVVQGLVSENVSMYISEGKFYEALKLSDFLFKQKNMTLMLKNLIRVDRATVFLLLSDYERIEALKENKSFLSFINAKGQSDFELLKYMYYSLHKLDEEKAKIHLKKYQKLVKNNLMATDKSYDDKLIKWTKKTNHWKKTMLVASDEQENNKQLLDEFKKSSKLKSLLVYSSFEENNKPLYPNKGMYLNLKIKSSSNCADIALEDYIKLKLNLILASSIKKALDRDVYLNSLDSLFYKDKVVSKITTEQVDKNNFIGNVSLFISKETTSPEGFEETFGNLGLLDYKAAIGKILYYFMPEVEKIEKSLDLRKAIKEVNKYLYKKDSTANIKYLEKIFNGKIIQVDSKLDLEVAIKSETIYLPFQASKILNYTFNTNKNSENTTIDRG